FLLPVPVCCLILGSLAPTLAQDAKSADAKSADAKSADAKSAVASLFEGVPPDLRGNIKTNSVRIDRINDWLSENVDGKGKAIEVELPVIVNAVRNADKTYSVEFIGRSSNGAFGPGGGGFGGRGGFGPSTALTVTVLGDTWPVTVGDGRGFGSREASFGFVGVSAADAEKFVELKKIRVQGKAKRVRVGETGISLALDDVLVDGQKLTPRSGPTRGGKKAKGQ
ncbi:MAG TPA: hypothetical protein VHR72_09325, partial [Gemmataceae bacterium]|nr:hypothetical protein [Gemmataceae bacterium]